MKNIRITFRVTTPELPEDDIVYIAGSHAGLGAWKARGVPLALQTSGYWEGAVTLPANSVIDYKFSLGSWESEAVDQKGRPFANFMWQADSDAIIEHDIPSWKHLAILKPPEHRITGKVIFHRDFKAPGLADRDVIVWLPENYEDDPQRRYPVLYTHDGQNMFDPLTSYTGVDWQADETATRMIANQEMQPIIMVAIYNTPQRLNAYSPSRRGRRYMSFIVDTLKPFIDTTYRTLPDRENTATIGSSMGGLISFFLWWRHGDVFGKAACMSPSFIYNKNRPIQLIRRGALPGRPFRLYMDCGGTGGERLLLRGCRRVNRRLRAKGLRPGNEFKFHYEPQGNHSEGAWGHRLWRPFQFLFPPLEPADGP